MADTMATPVAAAVVAPTVEDTTPTTTTTTAATTNTTAATGAAADTTTIGDGAAAAADTGAAGAAAADNGDSAAAAADTGAAGAATKTLTFADILPDLLKMIGARDHEELLHILKSILTMWLAKAPHINYDINDYPLFAAIANGINGIDTSHVAGHPAVMDNARACAVIAILSVLFKGPFHSEKALREAFENIGTFLPMFDSTFIASIKGEFKMPVGKWCLSGHQGIIDITLKDPVLQAAGRTGTDNSYLAIRHAHPGDNNPSLGLMTNVPSGECTKKYQISIWFKQTETGKFVFKTFGTAVFAGTPVGKYYNIWTAVSQIIQDLEDPKTTEEEKVIKFNRFIKGVGEVLTEVDEYGTVYTLTADAL